MCRRRNSREKLHIALAVVETSDGERILARLPADDNDKLAVGAAVIYDHNDDHGAVFRVR